MKTLKTSILVAFIMFFIGCDKEDTPITTTPIETPAQQNARIEALISSTTVTGNLIVNTVGEMGNNLPGVTITINNMAYSTGIDSRVIIENIVMNDEYVFIVAEKNGYEKVMKTITPSKNGLTNVELMLLNDIPSKTLDASTGGIITDGLVSLNFPANGIKDVNGNLYSGSVDVNMVYYNPTDTNFPQIQPGTLVGVTQTDELKALISEGMLTVDLTDINGNPLNVADGKFVKVTMPASSSGPSTIPFWHLNETYGIWVEEGSATKVGNSYEFDVSHFSTINVDVPVAATTYCVRFVDQNGNPLTNTVIETNFGVNRSDVNITDNIGEVCFIYAPNFQNQTYKAKFKCGSSTAATRNGNTVTIDVTNVSSLTNFKFRGSLSTCNNQLAVNKSFIIEVDDAGTKYYINGFSDQNGNYSVNENLCLSTGIYSATLNIIENNGSLVNNFYLDTSNTVIDLSACNFIAGINDNTNINFPDFDFHKLVAYAANQYTAGPVSGGPAPNLNYGQIKTVTTISYNTYENDSDNFYIDPGNPMGGGLVVDVLNIINLSGIQYLHSLQNLELRNQSISNITELALLPTLTNIDLRGNPISQSDITWLRQQLPNATILF